MITYQTETYEEVHDEWIGLIDTHYKEVCEFNKEKTRLNPDYAVYEEMAKYNRLFIFTCRYDKKLIGYYFSFILPHTHYKDRVTSQHDLVYVLPEYRKGMIGVKLIKKAETELFDMGVDIITLRIKAGGNLHSLPKRLGYKPLDTTYFKEV